MLAIHLHQFQSIHLASFFGLKVSISFTSPKFTKIVNAFIKINRLHLLVF